MYSLIVSSIKYLERASTSVIRASPTCLLLVLMPRPHHNLNTTMGNSIFVPLEPFHDQAPAKTSQLEWKKPIIIEPVKDHPLEVPFLKEKDAVELFFTSDLHYGRHFIQYLPKAAEENPNDIRLWFEYIGKVNHDSAQGEHRYMRYLLYRYRNRVTTPLPTSDRARHTGRGGCACTHCCKDRRARMALSYGKGRNVGGDESVHITCVKRDLRTATSAQKKQWKQDYACELSDMVLLMKEHYQEGKQFERLVEALVGQTFEEFCDSEFVVTHNSAEESQWSAWLQLLVRGDYGPLFVYAVA